MVITLILCFVVFLFCVYALSHEDFVIFRKNISMDHIFNLAFLTTLIGLFFSRVFYVATHFSSNYLNPLVFFIFPYFPGLSLVGAVIGGVLFVLIYTARTKTPTARILDYFGMSLLWAVCFGAFLNLSIFIILKRSIPVVMVVEPLLYLFVGIAFFALLLPIQRKAELKDGTLSLLFLLFWSVISIVVGIIGKKDRIWYFLGKEDVLFFAIIIISIFLLIKKEKLKVLVSTVFKRVPRKV